MPQDQVNYIKSPLLKPQLSKGQLPPFFKEKSHFMLHLLLLHVYKGGGILDGIIFKL